jgi:hypothetical protein
VDLYTFTVETFNITDTRALINDTLWLSYSAYVDGDLVGNLQQKLGSFDNGSYQTANYFPPEVGPGLANIVINDPDAKVGFIFQLVNSGNVPEGALTGRLAATADQMAGILVGLAGIGAANIGEAAASYAFPVGLALEAFANLWSWMNVDCDGPVAVDQVSAPRYALDAWTDNSPKKITINRGYPGSSSPTGCNPDNSFYNLIWSFQRSRTWVQVTQPLATDTEELGSFTSDTGVSACEHNGALHAFGVGAFGVNHARTFTGATWNVDALGWFGQNLTPNTGDYLPVTGISFDDRLHILGVLADGSVSTLAYTVDGGSWVHHATGPPPVQTTEAVAAAVFLDRLHVIVTPSTSGQIQMASTADMTIWTPWADVPSPGGLRSAVAAATLGGKLFLFGVFTTVNARKEKGTFVMWNSTADGVTWTGWEIVESGLPPKGAGPEYAPLDVAAGIFRNRVYIASRWQSTQGTNQPIYIAVNFSKDGDNWSGWRVPAVEPPDTDLNLRFRPQRTVGLAAIGNHLYILAPNVAVDDGTPLDVPGAVWAY